jgi:hypothetical protein
LNFYWLNILLKAPRAEFFHLALLIAPKKTAMDHIPSRIPFHPNHLSTSTAGNKQAFFVPVQK